MFNKYLEQTNKNTVNYFNNLFSKYFEGKKNIPNSIVLWGSDTLAQYFFSLEIARSLNCKKNCELDCNCLNCRWILNNEHPEIKTVSKIDSKPSNDETKIISVKQINEILNESTKMSDEYRVIILCDADYEKLNNEQINHLEKFNELKSAIKTNGEKYWTPKPLNSIVLQEEASNALLKTIEETPENLLFIFLTTSPNDLISTIISRSQMFYIQNTYNKTYDFSYFKDVLIDFPNTKKEDFYEFTQKSIDYINTNEITLIDFLENMQAYFTELLSVNYSDLSLKNKILDTIEKIIKAKKYKNAVIKDEHILDDLWVNIS